MAIPARLGNRPSVRECRNPEWAIQASERMNARIALTTGQPEAFNWLKSDGSRAPSGPGVYPPAALCADRCGAPARAARGGGKSRAGYARVFPAPVLGRCRRRRRRGHSAKQFHVSKKTLLRTAQTLDEVVELFKSPIGNSQFTAYGSFVENLSFQAQAAGQT